MRALVVGGAGFVGSHLVDRLLADGHTVDVVDDLSTGSLANLADARAMNDGTLKIHHLDVRSLSLGEVVVRRRPTVIYHLAVLPPGLPIAVAGEVAVGGLLNLLEAARAAEVAKIVVTLPAAVLYGAVSARELPAKEGQLAAAQSLAAVIARAMTDLLAVSRETRGIEFTALALGEVYGPRQRPVDGIVASFVESRMRNVAAGMPADGRQTFDLVYIDDTVDALARAAEKGTGLVINVGTGIQTSARDQHAMLCEPGPPWTSIARVDDVPTRFAVSPVRARIHLAWAPWTDLADGIAQVVSLASPPPDVQVAEPVPPQPTPNGPLNRQPEGEQAD